MHDVSEIAFGAHFTYIVITIAVQNFHFYLVSEELDEFLKLQTLA